MTLRDNLIRPTERELSRTLANYHVMSGTRDFITEEQAKKILVDYLELDNTHLWITRKIYSCAISQVNWSTVITESLSDEMINLAKLDQIAARAKANT